MYKKFYLLFVGLVTFINAYDASLLSTFAFHPLKNSSCYQVYNSTDTVTALTCRRPHKDSKRSCVTALKDSNHYCEISTPSGEGVRVPCSTPYDPPTVDSLDFDYDFTGSPKCYKTYKGNLYTQEICPIVIDNTAAAIVTPDGYTILIYSEFCKAFKSKVEIQADVEFTTSFTFDPQERSCYKIYTPDQPISQYTCYEDHIIYTRIHRSCVDAWEENDKCNVVKTQNNETIILDCEGETRDKMNCLKVYKDGNITHVCMEVLEEGCVGITTPSGLRMLFACRACEARKYYPVTYDKEKFRGRRKFVKKYLEKEMKNENSYYRSYFEIIVHKDKNQIVYPYWLPNSNCYGFALSTNETVMFKCTDREFKPGCFKVRNSYEKNETDICAFIYEENCVIVETPKGKRIIMGCYDEKRSKEQAFVKNELKKFKNGNYTFDNHISMNPFKEKVKKIYKTEKDCRQQIENYQTQWLQEHQCWGAVTPDLETIILDCPNRENKNKKGCFQIFTQNYTSDNQILPFSYETYETCIEIINDLCVGVVTRKGWNVQLSCYYYYDLRCCGSKPTETEME